MFPNVKIKILTGICAPGIGDVVIDMRAACDPATEAEAVVVVTALTGIPAACGDGDADRWAGNTGDWAASVTGRP